MSQLAKGQRPLIEMRLRSVRCNCRLKSRLWRNSTPFLQSHMSPSSSSVRISDFHSEDRGSNPLGDTNFSYGSCSSVGQSVRLWPGRSGIRIPSVTPFCPLAQLANASDSESEDCRSESYEGNHFFVQL